jgi:hypothetical protein
LRYLSDKRFLVVEEKGDLRDACETLGDANTTLRGTLNVRLPALDELTEANGNRLDTVLASLARYSDVQRRIKTVSGKEA